LTKTHTLYCKSHDDPYYSTTSGARNLYYVYNTEVVFKAHPHLVRWCD